jgi:hypothetical protein
MATASWYVGFRGGGCGGGGGGGATFRGGFAGGLTLTFGAVLTAFVGFREAAGRAADLTGRRGAWAFFLAARAGLRAEVRDLVTRRVLAISS